MKLPDVQSFCCEDSNWTELMDIEAVDVTDKDILSSLYKQYT